MLAVWLVNVAWSKSGCSHRTLPDNWMQSKDIASFRFISRHFVFRLSADVGQRWHYDYWIGRGRKCGCSHRNFTDILSQSGDMAHLRFIGRYFNFRLSADVGQCWRYGWWIEYGLKCVIFHKNIVPLCFSTNITTCCCSAAIFAAILNFVRVTWLISTFDSCTYLFRTNAFYRISMSLTVLKQRHFYGLEGYFPLPRCRFVLQKTRRRHED